MLLKKIFIILIIVNINLLGANSTINIENNETKVDKNSTKREITYVPMGEYFNGIKCIDVKGCGYHSDISIVSKSHLQKGNVGMKLKIER